MPSTHASGIQIELASGPVISVMTTAEVKALLKIQTSADDTDFDLIIPAATRLIEARLGLTMIEQTWAQIQDTAPSAYKLQRRPVLGVSKIEYMASESATSWTELDASYYYVAGRKVVARSAWPAIREVGGWKTTFKTGYYQFTLPNDSGQQAAARAAVPANLKLAVAQLTGHLYENKEGEGPELKYEVVATKYGALPPNVVTLIEPFFDWSMS